MANAGGAWDNAKKVVEVTLREKARRYMMHLSLAIQ
jgi:Na+/H+-translocating membrane pyrophosphatase